MKIHDSGNRSNRDLAGATPNGWDWVADTGTAASAMRISSNQIVRKGDQKTSTFMPSIRLATEDQKFYFAGFGGFPASSANLWMAVIFRYVDASNYHQVRFNPTTGSVKANITISQVGVASNTVTYTFPGAVPDYFNFSGTVKRSGTNVITTVFVDGAQVLQHTTAVAVAWPTVDNGVKGTVKITGYANSARVDSSSNAYYIDDFLVEDLVQPSRYELSMWTGSAWVPLKPEDFIIEWVVGEAELQYPNGVTEYPTDYPVRY